MGKNNNSKGSGVDLLAQAMKRVFKEAVEEGVEPLVELVSGVERSMATKKDVDTTNKNMQKQFAAQPGLISKEVHKILERKSGK